MREKFYKLFKKEILTILRDRKSFLTFIVMSVVLTPLLIGGVGLIQELETKSLEGQQTIIAVENSNIDSGLNDFLKNSDTIKVVNSSDYEGDLGSKIISGYLNLSQKNNQVSAEYVYDQSSNASTASALKVNTLIQAYSALLRQNILKSHNLNEKDLNPVVYSQITLQEVQNKPAQNDLVLFLIPYIILIGLIQGASQFAIELTAGEKERNTLATTLSLNASRTTIGLAKIAAILVLALVSLVLNVASLVVTFTLLSKSNLISGGTSAAQNALSFNINITPEMFLQIFLILLPLSFLIASLLVLLGTYARNQKEGGLYILPLIMATVFIGLSGQAFDVNTPAYVFFIPILSHVVLLKQVLLGYFIPLNYLISTLATVALFVVALLISINMFKREEVIFRQ